MRHYIVTNAARGTKVYLASNNSGMIRVDGASSGCRECGRDIAKHGVMNKASGIVNCDCGAGYAVRAEESTSLPDLLLAYRAAATKAERPDATSADHAAWLAAQAAFYQAGGRDPANGWPAVKCEIGWIDCHGARTPDNNEAMGFAVIGKLKFPVCADHARTIGSGRCHHGACVHMTSGLSSWTFEPFATEV